MCGFRENRRLYFLYLLSYYLDLLCEYTNITDKEKKLCFLSERGKKHVKTPERNQNEFHERVINVKTLA